MYYKELVQTKEGFQTSIHLECDINQLDKIESYIPSFQSTEILGQFIAPMLKPSRNNMRAKVLVGPYGKGKSHLLLILTALTSLDLMIRGEETTKTLENLQKKVNKVNENVGQMIKQLLEQKCRLLPIIVDSNSSDISQALLRALQDGLNRAELSDFLPSTHFDEVLNTIETWKSDYPPAYEALQQLLRKEKKTVEDFIVSLKKYDPESYKTFTELHPKITAGSQFFPFTQENVVKTYSGMVDHLSKSTEYSGVHIIFDEFSKFIETNINTSKMNNFQVIQELAEFAARSKEKQLHFTCITHKNIVEYSSSPNFKAVDGRFLEIPFVSSAQDNYELISNALEKTDLFRAYHREHKQSFDQLKEKPLQLFEGMEEREYEEHIIKGCFPLSPICAFSLIGISELVGQNERTMFTFLAQEDKNSLYTFLRKNRVRKEKPEFLTVDHLYDYFEVLFQKELHHTPIHVTWSKTSQALAQCDNKDEIRVLKAMAILKMIGDPRLKNTKAHLKATLMIGEEEFNTAVSLLLKKHILSLRDSQEYVLLTANGVDIKKSVLEYVSSKAIKVDTVALLSQHFPLPVVIPRRYNDDFCMFRYFPQVYVEFKVLSQYESPETFLTDYPYDGVIVHVLSKSPLSDEDMAPILHRFETTPQVLFCISEEGFSLESHLKDLLAMEYLKKKYTGDAHYLEELEAFEEDVKGQMGEKLEDYFAPYSKYSHFFSGGHELMVLKKSMLSQCVSDISLACYGQTPVINNEMVNKNSLNTQNIKARELVVSWMLTHFDKNIIPEMEGKGPEVSIFNSFYVATGLDQGFPTNDEGLNGVLTLIRDFLLQGEGAWISFDSLYHSLTMPPYGIRRGVLPLLIGFSLREFCDIVTISFKGKEIPLSPSLLSQIVEDSEGYSLRLDENTPERQIYLEELYNLFLPDALQSRSVYPLVEVMQQWARSLPEYTKYFTVNPSGTPFPRIFQGLRKELLQFELNQREFIWESIPRLLATEGDVPKTVEKLQEFVALLTEHLHQVQGHFVQVTCGFLSGTGTENLRQRLILWRESVSEPLNDGKSYELSHFVQWLPYEEEEILTHLVRIFVGTPLEEWNDSCASLYATACERCLSQTSNQSQQEKKAMEPIAISALGETLKSNLFELLEEYQDALEREEKKAILSSLLEELL